VRAVSDLPAINHSHISPNPLNLGRIGCEMYQFLYQDHWIRIFTQLLNGQEGTLQTDMHITKQAEK
jgi:hypothetical protein